LNLVYLSECLNLPEVAAYWQQVRVVMIIILRPHCSFVRGLCDVTVERLLEIRKVADSNLGRSASR